jgi:DNA polymerase III subunit alpha
MLDGVSKPKQIAKRCIELGYESAALTDHGGISGAVQFTSALKDAGIKPILGSELYICGGDPKIKNKDENWELTHLPVLAKNLQGWNSLIKITSFAHHKDHFYRKPRIDLATLAELGGGNLIAFSGHPGSDLANAMFINPSEAYNHTDYDYVKKYLVHPDWARRIRAKAGEYIDYFGKENFFLEIQVLDPANNPAAVIAALALRWLSQKTGIPRVGTADSHYPHKEDADDQRILLCSAMKKTLKAMYKSIEQGGPFRTNFYADCYHIPSLEEMQAWNDEEELVNACIIADMCESYDIRHAPVLPTYPCPNGISADTYLQALCRRGWHAKVYERVEESKYQEYEDRARRELNVIREAGLASYFLIVQDYCNWARRQGMIVGPGRGSGAGCLVSYLIGITNVDPIEYGLLFERFYNAGRNAPGHISLPDIDCDFPVARRKQITAYLKRKYGPDKVANIATFNSMKGRGALTDVLRAHDVSFDEVKRITANIPEESRITEELQAMTDKGEEPSIIRYALETDPDSFRDWCVLNDDGTCDGVLGPYFAQAMRLEGTKRNISMHAAGVVLASTPLAELCPLVYDDGIDGYIAGMEYPDLEAMGQVKLDILGVASLDKIGGVQKLLRYGYIEEDDAA